MPDFYYDEQVRRYILQFLRIFADFKIETPPDENGIRAQKRVPIRYGDMSRMVAHILKDNSQNVALSAPAMSGYITSIQMSPTRRQDTSFINKKRVIEREYDKETGTYSSEQGNRYMVETYMPVPYDLTMNLDIWTTNTTDKLQLFEQISTIFNPTVQLQTNDNPLDWSTIFEVELTDISWSSRGIPVGTDSPNDIMTLTFKVPVWINPPAKITRQKIVEEIVVTLFDLDIDKEDIENIYDPLRSCFEELDQLIVTPGNYKISVTPIDSTQSKVELLGSGGESNPDLSWEELFAVYGKIDPETTTLRLKTLDNIEDSSGDILGSLEIDTNEQNMATFTIDADTLPTTVPSGPVNDIIDPMKVYPGKGLPAAAPGQRYLLLSSSNLTNGEEPIIAQNTGLNPWGTIVAYENDIIEYNGTNWFVSFDATEESSPKYVINIDDGQHYKFDGNEWVYTYLAQYNPGYWRIEM